MSRFEDRRGKLRRKLKRLGADAILVSNFVNVSYLTGFTGDDSYLWLTQDAALILSDTRYDEQLEGECPDVERLIRATPVTMKDLLRKAARQTKTQSLAFESCSLTHAAHGDLVEALPEMSMHATKDWVLGLREIKDKEEIAEIREAVRLAERAFAVIRAEMTGDQTELQVAANLEHQIRRFGGRGCSFPPIVAVGPRAALPHARPTTKRIEESPFVLIDWGAVSPGGYMSDLTRVLATAKISPKLERIYGVVLKAQQAAIAKIRPGAKMSAVDAAARKTIAEAGFGKYFGHGLGHGFGLEIHEQPRLAPAVDRELKPGMVVTVEPGIYVPGWGGVRIEDDVLITRTGREVLTSTPKELVDIVVS